MTDLSTLARPYAIAAFEYAMQKNAVPAWGSMLQSAALLVKHPAIVALLSGPAVTKIQLAELFADVLTTGLDREKRNFLCLLAEYNRLIALPDIAVFFANYRAEQEKTMRVQVISAVALDEPYQQRLIASLNKRLQRNVSLQCSVDQALLGGAIIQAGDMVIDGSVRGKLHRLLKAV